MAIHVEDHPLDYFDFEGIIPAGNYGAGDVIVWDWGTWSLGKGDNPAHALEAGELHMDLHGVKLLGRFVLVRTQRSSASTRQDQWLFFRKHDEHSIAGWSAEEHPQSVKSGLTNEQLRSVD